MKQHNVGSPSTVRYEETNTYRKTTLENGVRIVTEEVPSVRSVSLGIWVRSGSRFEQPEFNGICHFIEHMLFKGTERRSAYDIAREIDSVGGVLNAFTSKELTSFYCRVLSDNLELAVDLLGDIFLNSSFPEEEIEREKQVVCQEIAQLEDSPEDLIHELLGMEFWLDDPLGRPILGTVEGVAGFDRDTLLGFQHENYVPQETVVCAAGDLEHERVVELVSGRMKRLTPGSPRRGVPVSGKQALSSIVERDLEQVHVCVAAVAPSAVDQRRHAAYILNTILGGGMSSRLFQEVRERRGLAYNVYSFLSAFSDTGMFGIYAGCDPERLEELVETMGRETMSLARTVTEEEVRTAKSHMKGNIVLAMESSESRMNRLAKGEYYFGRYLSMDEIIGAIDAVSLHDLVAVAEELINAGRFTLVALGPANPDADLAALFSSHRTA
jgi:predicted Zn-dependent peptidase